MFPPFVMADHDDPLVSITITGGGGISGVAVCTALNPDSPATLPHLLKKHIEYA